MKAWYPSPDPTVILHLKNFILCVVNCYLFCFTRSGDKTLIHTLCAVLNINLDSDYAWIEATLSV